MDTGDGQHIVGTFTPHHIPHFHAQYQGFEAIFRINPVALIGGSIPPPQARFVRAWAAIHHAELRANWARLSLDEIPFPIEPLRLRP